MTSFFGFALFLSGFSALVFESLLFRQGGLFLGNTVQAAAWITGGFFAGLALGNHLGGKWSRVPGGLPGRIMLVELAAGALACLWVWALPEMVGLATSLESLAGDSAGFRGLIRVLLAGVFFLLPSLAMGASFPLFTELRHRVAGHHFGSNWTLLYGANILGGIAGLLSTEFILIPALGVSQSGLSALSANLIIIALLLAFRNKLTPAGSRARPQLEETSEAGNRLPTDSPDMAGRAAFFLLGFLLLASETIWLRHSFQFLPNTHATFSLILAALLLASPVALFHLWLFARLPRFRFFPSSFLSSWARRQWIFGMLAALFTCSFPAALLWWTGPEGAEISYAGFSLLVFLVNFFPSVLFHHLARRNSAPTPGGGEAQGKLSGRILFWNSLGGATGALAGLYVFLPLAGSDLSFLILGLLFLVVGILAFPPGPAASPTGSQGISRPSKLPLVPALVGGLVAVLLVTGFLVYPIKEKTNRQILRKFQIKTDQLIAHRETAAETLRLARRPLRLTGGFPRDTFYYQLITNNHSMASTNPASQRYMGALAWLPAALTPGREQALLISYGLGVTAQSLLADPRLKRVDMVDPSREIVELSSLVYTNNPAGHSKARVFHEDARHYLERTNAHYDLITAEPPPPHNSRIVYLYTREYFKLLSRRLTDRGTVAYWLPVHSFTPTQAGSVIRAFCSSFKSCSLWAPTRQNFILLGQNHKSDSHAFSFTPFKNYVNQTSLRPYLNAGGVEAAEQLVAMFLTGDQGLRHLAEWDLEGKILTDDYPYRIRQVGGANPGAGRVWERLLSPAYSWGLFQKENLWKLTAEQMSRLRQAGSSRFITDQFHKNKNDFRFAHHMLIRSDYEIPLLWTLGFFDLPHHRAPAGTAKMSDARQALRAGLNILNQRAIKKCAAYFGEAVKKYPGNPRLKKLELYCRARVARSQSGLKPEIPLPRTTPIVTEYARWRQTRPARKEHTFQIVMEYLLFGPPKRPPEENNY